MGITANAIKALKEVIVLKDLVSQIKDSVGQINHALLDHEKRLVKLETKLEVYEQLAKESQRRKLPPT
jgi:hypothetical protein